MGTAWGAVVFGLAAALTWGGGDFCGGLASRRAAVLAVLGLSQAAGLAALVLLGLLWREPLPPLEAVGWGAAAGVAGTLGLGMLYAGLARGAAAVVAPVSAVLSAAIPVLITALSVGLPEAPKLAGFAVALAGIWCVARSDDPAGTARGLGYAVLAGCGFGGFFVLIDRADGTFWPLAVARCVTLLLVLPAVLLRDRGALRRVPRVAFASGLLDAGGNVFFVLASQLGRLDTAAVLSSLYPASTVLLSRLVLAERIGRIQQLGLLLVLGAIVLIAG
ncbi:MAG TPA: EamA family transporter [Roseiflexaceae bacterium]|nr:EamA family transporter [Roseiflexaceae bacterium]